MASEFDYDVLIIGAGPGGYVAAIRASQLGLKAAVVEKDKPGGVCLNIGCIPSKALIHQAGIFSSIPALEGMGLSVDRSTLDYSKVYEKSRAAADTLSRGVQFLLKKNNVELISGEAVIDSPHGVLLKDGKKITAGSIIIATGSRPREIPGFAFDEEIVLSSTGMLMQKSLPKSLLILGSGAIGVEFAYIMNAFGVEVHLVEMLDRILPVEDSEVVEVLARSFRRRGIQMYTSTKAVSMNKTAAGAEVVLEDKAGKRKTLTVEKLLVSVGRAPNTETIGLDKIGLKTEKGFIPVGDYYCTSVSGVYAIGDVVASPLLAHVASKEGEIAVEYIAGKASEKKINLLEIPGATYCEPQIGSFGPTEEKLREKNIPYKKSTFPYRGAGKSVATEHPDGLVKILSDTSTGELLGVHIVGAEATELIHELLLAKKSELLPEDVSSMIHAHPTLSETLLEAMRAVEDRAIHA